MTDRQQAEPRKEECADSWSGAVLDDASIPGNVILAGNQLLEEKSLRECPSRP
jgi:hypothetical protein